MRAKILAFLPFICLISMAPAKSQAPFDMEAYLQTASYDKELELYKAQLDFLQNNNYNKPWIQRVEFRMGTNTADFNMDRYRIRVLPSNPAEIKANNMYHSQQLNNVNTNYEVALNKALRNRYQLLIDHYYFFTHKDLLVRKHHSISELVKLFGTNNLTAYDMGDLINVESNISEMLIEISKLQMDLDEVEYFISLDMPIGQGINWNEMDLVGMDAIRSYVLKIEQEEDERNIYVRKAEQSLVLKQQMHRVNLAEARSNIGYLESSLNTNRGRTLYDHFGFQFGVRLPIFNHEKPDLNREKFSLLKDAEEVNSAKLLVQRRSDYLRLKLNGLFNQYDIINERIKSIGEASYVVPVERSINMFHLIRHRNYSHDLEERQLKISKEIYETYIEYLDIKGHLVGEPLVNYLSPVFKTIHH